MEPRSHETTKRCASSRCGTEPCAGCWASSVVGEGSGATGGFALTDGSRGTEMADRLLTMKEVRQLTRLGETKVRDMIDAGKFPRARQVGPRAVRWRMSDVETWIASLPAATGVIHDD